jgi:hypothetical protein
MHFIYVDLPHPEHLTVKMVAAYSSGKLVTTKRNIWFHSTQNGHLNTYCLENLTSYGNWSKNDNTSKQANKWHLLSKFLIAGTQTYLPDSFLISGNFSI